MKITEQRCDVIDPNLRRMDRIHAAELITDYI